MTARAFDRTGVEMAALIAVPGGAIALAEQRGDKRGTWRATARGRHVKGQ